MRSSPAAHAWAIISAGLAPILLTGAYLMAGLLQPASYSPVRTTISAMAGQAGTDRWVMTGGIFLVGGCYLVTAAGLRGVRASARALLAVAGMAGIGIAASPEPARGAAPRHLAWTVLGAVTIAAWPAFAARRAAPRPLILSGYGSAAVTAVFVGLLGWLLAETRDGSVLGLAERLTTSIQTCWPFIIAVALRRTHPGLAIDGSGPGLALLEGQDDALVDVAAFQLAVGLEWSSPDPGDSAARPRDLGLVTAPGGTMVRGVRSGLESGAGSLPAGRGRLPVPGGRGCWLAVSPESGSARSPWWPVASGASDQPARPAAGGPGFPGAICLKEDQQ